MQMSHTEWKIGRHVCSQCISCAVSTNTALKIHLLVGLRVAVCTVTSLFQPVAVSIIPLPLAEVVECTTGGNHGWHKAEMKVTSFLKNSPPWLQQPEGHLYPNPDWAKVNIKWLLLRSQTRTVWVSFDEPVEKWVRRVTNNEETDILSFDVPHRLQKGDMKICSLAFCLNTWVTQK